MTAMRPTAGFLLFGGMVVALGSVLVMGARSVGPNKYGRATVVIHPPSPKNSYYRPFYRIIANFMVQYAHKVFNRDNLIMLTQNENLDEFYSKLGGGVCLPTSVDDIWMRDFTTAKMSPNQVQFRYRPKYLEPRDASYIQDKFLRNMQRYGAKKYIKSSRIILDGGNVVDNDFDTAILTSRVIDENPGINVKGSLKRLFGYRNIVIIDELEGDTTGHSDGMVSFIDRNVVALTELDPEDQPVILKQLRQQLPKHFKIVVIPSNYKPQTWRHFSSACGLNVNLLATDKYLYVPTFGGDRENRRLGLTPRNDKDALTKIRKNTGKTVVPVPVPHKVCRMGGNVRCLSWQIKGPIADQLVKAAKDYEEDYYD